MIKGKTRATSFSEFFTVDKFVQKTRNIMKSYKGCIALFLLAANVESFAPSAFRSNVRSSSDRLYASFSKRKLIGKRRDDRQSSTSLGFFSNGDNEEVNGSSNGAIDYTKVKPEVEPQRWVQLAYLSLLALLSDWVCFSVAAAPSTFQDTFDHSAASIIDIFLFTNVATSFLVTDVIRQFGLQRAIQAAALLMATGCWFRAGFGFLPGQDGLVDYPFIVIGTVLVGIAQPFFQCTPPLLSAMWFANNERSTSTAIALNFNQIGIATAFLVGGSMATTAGGLENYFGLIAVMTTLITVGTFLQFKDKPVIPPSASELEKRIKGGEEPPFLESVQKFFSTRGFTNALAAFICSIAITNVVGVSVSFKVRRKDVLSLFN